MTIAIAAGQYLASGAATHVVQSSLEGSAISPPNRTGGGYTGSDRDQASTEGIPMDVDKLNTGEKIAGVSAVLSLHLHVLHLVRGRKSPAPKVSRARCPAPGGSAWGRTRLHPDHPRGDDAGRPDQRLPAFLSDLRVRAAGLDERARLTVLGGLSVLLVLFRIIDPPSFGSFGGVSVDGTLEFGIFLGLISAAGIAYGGYRGMQEEGATFSGTADKLSSSGGGPSDPPPPPSSTPPPPPPRTRSVAGDLSRPSCFLRPVLSLSASKRR